MTVKDVLNDTFQKYSVKDYYVLFIIVTGYVLLRPRIIKLFSSNHNPAGDETTSSIGIDGTGGDSSDDDDGSQEKNDISNASWGNLARRRQKKQIKILKKKLIRKAEMEIEDESDKEIEDLLED